MARVSAIDGISYGFRLFGYGSAVTFISLLIVVLGVFFAREGEPLPGVALILFGLTTLYAGVMGFLYKVIADGVDKGMESSTPTVDSKSDAMRIGEE